MYNCAYIFMYVNLNVQLYVLWCVYLFPMQLHRLRNHCEVTLHV